MEVFFSYASVPVREIVKMKINFIRVPQRGNLVFYKGNRKSYIGRVDYVFYDYAAESIIVFIIPLRDEKNNSE